MHAVLESTRRFHGQFGVLPPLTYRLPTTTSALRALNVASSLGTRAAASWTLAAARSAFEGLVASSVHLFAIRVALGSAHGGPVAAVSALGFDHLPLDQRPGLPPNSPTRRVFEGPAVVNGPGVQRQEQAVF